jgi:hypothetical protein
VLEHADRGGRQWLRHVVLWLRRLEWWKRRDLGQRERRYPYREQRFRLGGDEQLRERILLRREHDER